MAENRTYNITITESDIRRMEERLSERYFTAKNCSSGVESEKIFDKIIEVKYFLSIIGLDIYPPNNRNAVHIEVHRKGGK